MTNTYHTGTPSGRPTIRPSTDWSRHELNNIIVMLEHTGVTFVRIEHTTQVMVSYIMYMTHMHRHDFILWSNGKWDE